jgi:ABC-type multidrug transport system ATPase subunit
VVFTTHYLEEAERADAVCILRDGRIIERGTPAEVRTRQEIGGQPASTLEDAYLVLIGGWSR